MRQAMSEQNMDDGDATYAIEFRGAVIAEGDTRAELAERAMELQGKALVFHDGEFEGAFDTPEEADAWVTQRSYDVHIGMHWTIVQDEERLLGLPLREHNAIGNSGGAA